MAVRVKAVGVRTNRKTVQCDDWDTIADDYKKASFMACKPDDSFKKVKTGDVLDEEKSVRWNREEVERLKAEYDAEVKRLNQEKNKAITAIMERAIALIASEADISEDKARTVWNFVYQRYHAYGEVFSVIYDYITFAEILAH